MSHDQNDTTPEAKAAEDAAYQADRAKLRDFIDKEGAKVSASTRQFLGRRRGRHIQRGMGGKTPDEKPGRTKVTVLPDGAAFKTDEALHARLKKGGEHSR
jgi:hypothetical protein